LKVEDLEAIKNNVKAIKKNLKKIIKDKAKHSEIHGGFRMFNKFMKF